MQRAVFLDRDGVLNRAIVRDGKPYPPASLDELEVPEDVPTGCRSLRASGFLLVLVTNQPDVARGTQSRANVEAINTQLARMLCLDDVRCCFHDENDRCACRKPKPGMLLAAAEQWQIDPRNSYMLGDRWRDIDAGRAAGCRTILINRNYDEALRSPPDHVTESFTAAVSIILSRSDPTGDDNRP
jgi:D-glycero-D-manno-heptose 1,7-bisphosphate phosphatase